MAPPPPAAETPDSTAGMETKVTSIHRPVHLRPFPARCNHWRKEKPDGIIYMDAQAGVF